MNIKKILLLFFGAIYMSIIFSPVQSNAYNKDVPGLESGQTYYIRNSDSGRYLELELGRDAEGQNVHTGDSYISNSPAQLWRIYRNYDGTYKIFPIATKHRRSLEREAANAQIGIDLADQSNTINSFTLFRTNAGTYTIEDSLGRYLTENSSTRNVYFDASYCLERSRWCFVPAHKTNAAIYYSPKNGTGSTNILGIKNKMDGLGYRSMILDSPYAMQVFNEIYESNILCVINHGTDAGMSFVDDGQDTYYYYSRLYADTGVPGSYTNGVDANIRSIYINELSSARLVMYIGCLTGVNYTPSGSSITYNLVDETYNKGAHCVIGVTDYVVLPNCNDWVNAFFSRACDGWCINDCINYACDQNSELDNRLYILGDVKQRLDQ